MEPPPGLLVLVIEDDADTRANLRDILELDGYRVVSAATAAEALAQRDWAEVFAIILDYRLPDGSAETLLPRLRQLAPRAAIIISTGTMGLGGAVVALRYGASDYILKPIDPDALRASLGRIAEQRRLTAAKERSEAAFRSLVEAAPCMIVILRPDGRLLYFSPYAEELTGYRAAEVVDGDYLTIFLPDATRPAVREEIQRAMAGGLSRGYENLVRCKDGTERWIVWNAQRLEDYEGEPALLGVGQDITQQKQAQEKALQQERLAAIGQMMTGLAHESGNALARSRACLEMLTWEVQDHPEAVDLIQRILKAQDHLQHLYEEVRGYASPVVLERDVWDLRAIWRQAWDNLALRRAGRETTLHEHVEGVDLRCSVDQFRLEQVFRNILDNALAAVTGPLVVDIHAAEASLNGARAVCLRLRDNGPGLLAEQRQRIFEPFYTTKTKGTGLGMAIARRIVDSHGGRIAIGSGSGPGAEIVITLPREAS